MRPKKSILLHCADPNRRRELTFVLHTRGYVVLAGISPYPPLPNVALVVDDLLAATETAHAIVDVHDVPILVLAHNIARLDAYPPVQFLSNTSPAIEILESVRRAALKRRGAKVGHGVSEETRARMIASQRARYAEKMVMA
jgi:hypothetical protein